MPVGSQNPGASPADTGIWSDTYPIDTTRGVGLILNPTPFIAYGSGNFAMHFFHYVVANVPDPDRAIVTYTFNAPTVVNQLELIQHANGITRVEGFAGDNLGNMHSIGNVLSAKGDVTTDVDPYPFYDGESTVFDFNNTTVAGTYFQFIVTKSSNSRAFANYRAYPSDASGNHYMTTSSPVPEPSTYLAGLSALGMLGLFGWRNRK